MSGHRKGKGATPGVGLAAPKKPWEKRYQRGLTPLRSKAMPGPKKTPSYALLPGGLVTFKAKPGLGGRRHRLRRAKAGGAL